MMKRRLSPWERRLQPALRTRSVLTITLLAPLLAACSQASPPSPEPVSAPIAQTNPAVHEIILPHDEPDFPAAPGRELFIARCTVCHSLRYVTMQPDFPKKTWAKEVAKMMNTYGAHVTGEEARQIIEYLSTIKGSDSHQGSPATK